MNRTHHVKYVFKECLCSVSFEHSPLSILGSLRPLSLSSYDVQTLCMMLLWELYLLLSWLPMETMYVCNQELYSTEDSIIVSLFSPALPNTSLDRRDSSLEGMSLLKRSAKTNSTSRKKAPATQ